VHVIFGMLTTKDPVAFLSPLAPLVRSLHALAIPGEHSSLSASQAAAAARESGIDTHQTSDVAAALDAIIRTEPSPARVLICGSLYLAGSVLADNG
jgi:dihydrofolate synthase / folylpolyglutamate synthase